jgi:hypothetical protein
VFQDAEVVRHEVGRKPEKLCQLAWRGVADQQPVDDRQPCPISQRAVNLHPAVVQLLSNH